MIFMYPKCLRISIVGLAGLAVRDLARLSRHLLIDPIWIKRFCLFTLYQYTSVSYIFIPALWMSHYNCVLTLLGLQALIWT